MYTAKYFHPERFGILRTYYISGVLQTWPHSGPGYLDQKPMHL